MDVYWVSDVRPLPPWDAVFAGLRGLGFRMCGYCAPAGGWWRGMRFGLSFERRVRWCGRLGGVVRLGAVFFSVPGGCGMAGMTRRDWLVGAGLSAGLGGGLAWGAAGRDESSPQGLGRVAG